MIQTSKAEIKLRIWYRPDLLPILPLCFPNFHIFTLISHTNIGLLWSWNLAIREHEKDLNPFLKQWITISWSSWEILTILSSLKHFCLQPYRLTFPQFIEKFTSHWFLFRPSAHPRKFSLDVHFFFLANNSL